VRETGAFKKQAPSPSISLEKAVEEEPVSFGGQRREFKHFKKKRKPVDVTELKKTLEESLNKNNNEDT